MSQWDGDGSSNKGSLAWPRLEASMDLRALVGHRAETPKEGMVTVVEETRSRMVLDHLTMTVAPASEKIMSPIHKCLVKSKPLAACGNILDNLKKEKKAKEIQGYKNMGIW